MDDVAVARYLTYEGTMGRVVGVAIILGNLGARRLHTGFFLSHNWYAQSMISFPLIFPVQTHADPEGKRK